MQAKKYELVPEDTVTTPDGQQYRLLIQFIELRAAEAQKTFQPEQVAA